MPGNRFAIVTLVSLVAVLAWDASGLDLAMARWAGGPAGFSMRDDWVFAQVLHNGVRVAAWLFSVALCAAVVWPVGPLTAATLLRRVQIPACAIAATGLIAGIKGISGTSCPWDLAAFGGVAQYVSHWQGWLAGDGGSGHCFPAAHAASGFAFISGFFALRAQHPRLARRWLGVAMLVGFGAGFAQQMRGAHFFSHTLWSAWICWVVAWLSDPLFQRDASTARATPVNPIGGDHRGPEVMP